MNDGIKILGGVAGLLFFAKKRGSLSTQTVTKDVRITRETEKAYLVNFSDSGVTGWIPKSQIRHIAWVPGYEPNLGHDRFWNYKRITLPKWLYDRIIKENR